MSKKRILSLLLALVMVLGTIAPTVSRAEVTPTDSRSEIDLLGEWEFPTKYRIEDLTVRQEGITFKKVGATNKTLELKAAVRATATPAQLEWIYLRLDPALEPYIEEIRIRNQPSIVNPITYERYFEKVTEQSIAEVQLSSHKSNKMDPYSQWTDDLIYRVPLYARSEIARNRSDKYTRKLLSGNWGVLPAIMLEASRFEIDVTIQLNKDVSTIAEENEGRNLYGVQWRLQGNKDENGVAVITKTSLHKATIIDLTKVSDQVNNSNWLKAQSTHKVTSQLEGQIMGDNGKFSNELKGTGKSLIRIQNTMLPGGVASYRTAVDLKRPVSFNIQIDPKLLSKVADDDYIKVWQVFRESSITKHDGPAPIVKIPKAAFDSTGKVKIVVDKQKASQESLGEYLGEPGIIYIYNDHSFVSKDTMGPFANANFVDIPMSMDSLGEYDYEQYKLATWFTDVEDGKERIVKLSDASSYINVYPLTIHMYRINTENKLIDADFNVVSEAALNLASNVDKAKAQIGDFTTAVFKGEKISTDELLKEIKTEGYKFILALPEQITIENSKEEVDAFYLPSIIPVVDPDSPIPDGYQRVTFLPGDHGVFGQVDDKDQATVFDVLIGEVFDLDMAPKVTANDNFAFDKWDKDLSIPISELIGEEGNELNVKALYKEASRKPHSLAQEKNILTAKVDVTSEMPLDAENAKVVLKDANGEPLEDPVTGMELPEIVGTIDAEGNISFNIEDIADGTVVTIELSEKDKSPTLSDPFTIIKERPEAPTIVAPTAADDKNDIVIGNLVDDVVYVDMKVSDGPDVTFTKEDDGWTSSDPNFTVKEGANGSLLVTPADKEALDKKTITVTQTNEFNRESEPASVVAHTVFDKAEVTNFEILTDPEKLGYKEGEAFNPEGMTVQLTDKFDNTKVVAADKFEEEGITITPASNTKLTVADHNGKKVKASFENFERSTKGNLSVVYAEKTATPTVDPIHTGDTKVTGTAEPGATLTVVYTGSNNIEQTDTIVVPENGKFEMKIEPAHYPSTFVVSAHSPNKLVSEIVEQPVIPNTEDLKEAIKEGNAAAEGLDPETQDPEDRELLDAIAAGQDILDDNGEAKEGYTQQNVDDAAQRIRDAIKAKQEADDKDKTEEEKEEKRQANIKKLQDAIERGEKFLEENPDVIQEDKDKLQAAIDEAKIDLDKFLNGTEDEWPTDAKVDTDVKNIDDAIAKARKKSTAPTIDEPIKTGAATVSGTGNPGDTITVTFPGGFTAKTKVTPEGTWEVEAPNPLVSGDKVIAIAKEDNPNKVASDPVEATVGINTAGLEDAITEAKPVVEDESFDPTNSNTDKKLDEAYNNANDVLEKANNNDPNTDQEAVDKAEKDLRDALKEKEDYEAAKEAVTKAEKDPTDANIKDAQEKVDKLPGSTDPNADDFNKDKKDLQDRIDAINKTSEITVDTPKNGETVITGKTAPNAVVTVKMSDGATYTGTANENGEFSVPTRELIGGETVEVKAKDGDKPETAPVTVVVETDVNDLKAAIGEGEEAMEDANDPMTPEDEALQAAINEGKGLIDETTGEAKPGVTQKQADEAAKKIRDAIKAKEEADGSAADIEQKQKDLITKLEEAIKRGEDFKADPDNSDVRPEDMAKLDTAIEKAKTDLEKLKNPNWVNTNDPDEPTVDQDIKDIDDAIANAKKITSKPTIDSVKKGGNEVTGLTEPGATVEITTPQGKGTVVADNDGKFSFVSKTPFEEGDIITAVATGVGKVASEPATTTVGVYTGDLNQAIADGEKALEEKPNTPPTTADKKLQDAIDAGKDLVDEKGEAKPGVTQEEVDEATQKIKEAMDQKEAEDAVKALEDKQKEGQPITPEEIQDAQDKIDKLPGSTDPSAPDYNKDKKDLQDRLDKVKAMEDLKDAVEKGKEEKDKAIADGKPQEVINELDEVIKEGEAIIGNNGEEKSTVEIQEVVKEIERVIEKINKKSILVKIENASIGRDIVQITTNPGNANLEFKLVKANGTILEFNKTTTATGVSEIILEKPLEQFDMIFITATKDGYLKFTKSILVN